MAVSALVKQVLGTLSSLATQEFGLLWGFKDDVLSIKNDFEQIEAVVEDAEENDTNNNAVELWVKRLRSASLEVENVLDEISTEALLQRVHEETNVEVFRCWNMVSALFNYHLVSRVMIAHKVKDIKRKLDAIASKRFELNLTRQRDVKYTGVAGEMPDRETSSYIHDSSTIIGRDNEKETVTRTICNKDIGKYDNGEIRVYAISGMGGIGKTTLAQLVYNDEKVIEYFELRCWVYVSENFQHKETMKKIIESIDKHECRVTQLETLQDSLQENLRGKRFLIVLDDVWVEEDEKDKWEVLSKTLSCGAEGSIVVITTRSGRTSRMMAKVHELQHEIGCLSEEDAWSLFNKFAFAQGREGDDISELEPIGREMVEKCKGLPLAVKTLGGLMWSKRSTRDWKRVKHNTLWNSHGDRFLPALKLSYDKLPPHLKRCFAYCCLFPKGYNMEKKLVIQLWVVNGFIPSSGQLVDLYVIGEEIFDCLVWRSFFQVHKMYNIITYKMHDLMHDMAQHVMSDDCLIIDRMGKRAKIPNEVLHLSSSCPDFLFSPQELRNSTSLRSILMLASINESCISQILNHVYLRVLYLNGIRLETLPKSICKLKYLRYLNLSSSSIYFLPESIIYLQNLQVLLLNRCIDLIELPKGLRYMINLQFLDIRLCFSLRHLPYGIKELTSLRLILSFFPVGKESGAKIRELGNLNIVEEKLVISKLENVEGGLSEARDANLKGKTNLLYLKLKWSYDHMFTNNDEEVLEGLEPNSCLLTLKISYYKGTNISPSWIVSLTNLVEISFSNCVNCECIPALGRLPKLRVINLSYMNLLKCFHEDDTNTSRFVSLQQLFIRDCHSLVSLPSNLPKLKVLRLINCNNLVSIPDWIHSSMDDTDCRIDECKHLPPRDDEDDDNNGDDQWRSLKTYA